jgi:hypothetical protein
LALSDFLAKDEGGNNEVATAAAAATRINFLIIFIGFLPPREGLTMFAAGRNASAQKQF